MIHKTSTQYKWFNTTSGGGGYLPVVDFAVELCDFQGITKHLMDLERKLGLSSVVLFRQYLDGSLALDKVGEEWLDYFMLYLGTKEIRQYAATNR